MCRKSLVQTGIICVCKQLRVPAEQKHFLECYLTWAVAKCGHSTSLRKHAVHHTDLFSGSVCYGLFPETTKRNKSYLKQRVKPNSALSYLLKWSAAQLFLRNCSIFKSTSHELEFRVCGLSTCPSKLYTTMPQLKQIYQLCIFQRKEKAFPTD